MDTMTFVSYAGTFLLTLFTIWRNIEYVLDKRHLARYKPTPIPEQAMFDSSQVSVLVCTLDTLLTRCLHTWLANKPLEVIIVTTVKFEKAVRRIVADANLTDTDRAKIRILASPKKGKRVQMAFGIEYVKGAVIASCDDHISWDSKFLEGMLACLDDKDVGIVAPNITSIIPIERQDSKVITPWEVMSTRSSYNRQPKLKLTYAAGRWVWIVAGVTYLIRTSIVQTTEFLEAYTNDRWNGGPIMDVGEDCFISRWVLKNNWLIAVQDLPQTQVFRTIKQNSAYIWQGFRWERSTIQAHWRMISELPQIYNNTYVWRKTWGRALRLPLTIFHLFAWITAVFTGVGRIVALLSFASYLAEAVPTYVGFFEMYPYMAGKWYAVVMQDFFWAVQDPVCYATLGDLSWEGRE